jgi:hypothetical protein
MDKTVGQLSTEAESALQAIFTDAYQRGHRQGFLKGVDEKAWLHRNWPALTLLISFVSMLVGVFIGANAGN